jgi:8-amino-7-oxononanoate synthase
LSFEKRLKQRLEQLSEKHRYRRRKVISGACSPTLSLGASLKHNFCSNDYLGLASHPDLVVAMQRAVERYGVGSGASQLVSGYSEAHEQLELDLARLTGRDRVLVFSSGYMANLGVLSALAGRGDQIYEDRLNHASLLDGGLMSGARFRRFRHGDPQHLEKLLGESEKRAGSSEELLKMVVSDAVFSMDGDIAPLRELARVASAHEAVLMVDDAHGFGVMGASGAGTLEHLALDQCDVPILVGTFGKALGTAGAFVAGSEALIENLVQFSRTLIYTTAMPPALAETTRTALKFVVEDPDRRDRLSQRIQYFRQQANTSEIPLLPSDTPIQPLLTGNDRNTVTLSEALFEKGFLVGAIRPPTVPEGQARLRITLSAVHDFEVLDELLRVLSEHRHLFAQTGGEQR